MAVTKRPASTTKKPATDKAVEAFIGSAPDAVPTEKEKPTKKGGLMRGKKEQISHTMAPSVLEKVDAIAEKKGLSRAGIINLAISEYLERQGIE